MNKREYILAILHPIQKGCTNRESNTDYKNGNLMSYH